MDARGERRGGGGQRFSAFSRSLCLSCSLCQHPPPSLTPPPPVKNKKELTVEAGQQPRCQRFPLTRSEGGEKEGKEKKYKKEETKKQREGGCGCGWWWGERWDIGVRMSLPLQHFLKPHPPPPFFFLQLLHSRPCVCKPWASGRWNLTRGKLIPRPETQVL